MTTRRPHAHHATTTIALALALALTAGLRPAQAADPPRAACTARPGHVTLTTTGRVRAGRVLVACAGTAGWQADEVVMYQESSDATRPGKWIFGGDQIVTGHGDTTIPAFQRDYHECAYWKLRVTFRDGTTSTGATTEFCS